MHPQAQQMLYVCRHHYLASGRQDAAARCAGRHALSLPVPLINKQVVLTMGAPAVSFPEGVPRLTQLGGCPVTH